MAVRFFGYKTVLKKANCQLGTLERTDPKLSWYDHSSCLESLRGESKLMTLGNLVCAGCGTGNGGGVGCAGGKVGRNPTLPPAHPPLKGKKGGPPLSSH